MAGRIANRQFYVDLARVAYELMASIRPQTTFKFIEEAELEEADAWRLHPDRQVGWCWRAVLRQERKVYKRFEVALWHGGVLCGLMVCRVSDARVNINVKFIEGPPFDHPLKGTLLQLAVAQAEVYAGVIGASSVAIHKPIPEIAHLYEALGYEMVYRDRAKVTKGLKPRYDLLVKAL
ncbi:hypothetical protein QU755_18290 [Pseudomonas wenzhouensis]|nr:hypothetical protein [Pseudomonas wenzhouensis]MDM9653354.1 hypothetical protein [Pseudomonas wenzhouensis]MDM9653355.1 hypothetical protein [Pseudomonas wenzhouensis]